MPEGSATTEQLARPRGAARRLRLVVVTGPDRGRSLLLTPGEHRVGKSSGCQLRLTDAAVSAEHLSIAVGDDGGVVVTDVGSTNGSYFGGARFSELELDRAATFTIGKTELRVEPVDAAIALEPSPHDRFGPLVGGSEAMRRLYTLLERVAPTEASVLIEGETGTGKELVARAIHEHSPRRTGSYVVCDLGSLGATLGESELFGHVRGAFTGAHRDRVGAFEAAHGGTIFLDEIGELPVELQPRLLRALDARQVRPVGAVDYQPIDVRIVAATNRDLASEVKAGRFREDLYHRLNIVTARVPSLRERTGDVAVLVEHFLAGHGRRPEPAALELLAAYDWPGNVRELRNVVERAAALDLALTPALVGLDPAVTTTRPAVDPGVPFKEAKGALIDAWERDYVTALLASCGDNVSLAARRAGMDRAYLHRLLKKHGVA